MFYFTVHKLRCFVFNIFKICTFTHHSIMSRFALDALLGLDAIISLISLFPFGLIGEHKWIPKWFMVTTWINFSSGNSNIFLASHFCLSHRLRQLLQMPLGVNCLRLNLLHWAMWGQWGLEHLNDPLHWTINLSPLNQLRLLLIKFDQGLPSLEDSKRFSGLNGILKMALPSISCGNYFTCLTGVFSK